MLGFQAVRIKPIMVGVQNFCFTRTQVYRGVRPRILFTNPITIRRGLVLEGITEMTNTRRSGWSGEETRLLWETAEEAGQKGLPLKAVFERIARETGRRPNSIRNYYYAQVAKREGGGTRTARFVPFTEQ